MIRNLLTATVVFCAGPLLAQDAGLAKDFYLHGLKSRALETFIEVLHSPKATPADRAEALYYMGQISFDENSYSTALDDWQSLIRQYPKAARSIELKDRLTQLKEVFAKTTDAAIDSLVARSYIQNGDFWSQDDRKLTIDSSWLQHVELAVDWYDRVIKEFPDSSAAELAYQRKLFALVGWRDLGRDDVSYGVKGNFRKYMPQLLETFAAFETAFPKNGDLQGFRYQIAQAYWGQKDWANTRLWLNKIIDAGGGQTSFYVATAKARLGKIEY
jgi:tetratricopeptide (TPR) repeat protein